MAWDGDKIGWDRVSYTSTVTVSHFIAYFDFLLYMIYYFSVHLFSLIVILPWECIFKILSKISSINLLLFSIQYHSLCIFKIISGCDCWIHNINGNGIHLLFIYVGCNVPSLTYLNAIPCQWEDVLYWKLLFSICQSNLPQEINCGFFHPGDLICVYVRKDHFKLFICTQCDMFIFLSFEV